jgi:hypothetical protein
MPDLDTEAILAGLFGEAELIAQPPRTATGYAATLPHVQASMEADRRAAASPQLAALKDGRIVARVIPLIGDGVPAEKELPHLAWCWDFRWKRGGTLFMRDPSGDTWRFAVAAFTRPTRTEAPEAAGEPAILSTEVQETPREQRYEQARERREQVIRSIRDAGNVPATPDYPVSAFVHEVRTRCGLSDADKVRGFDRRTLQRIRNQLKT